MNVLTKISIALVMLCPSFSLAMQSTNYGLKDKVVNSGGNTQSSAAYGGLVSIGETMVGQIWGGVTSAQVGFFNDYFIAPPTATPSATVTVTLTPIRQFDGELLHKQWVYAAPNPIRGKQGRLVYHLSEDAKVELKIYSTTNRLVLSKRWNNISAGQRDYYWSCDNMANGVYMIYIKATNGSGKTTVIKKRIALVK